MGRREEANRRNRVALLDAGADVLRRSTSVDELTVRAVCASAGVSPSTFYRLFGDRDGFLGALHLTLLERARTDGAALLERVNRRPGPMADWIPVAVEEAQNFAAESLWFVGPFGPLLRRDPNHSRFQSEARAWIATRAFDALAGRLDATDPRSRRRVEVAVWVVGVVMVRGTSSRAPLHSDAPDERRRIGTSISNMLVAYLDPERSTAVPLVEVPTLPIHRPDDGSTRTRILDAAEALLGTRDVAELTTLDIAVEAGVAPATIHDVFGSRHGLIGELLQRGLEDVAAIAEAALESAEVDRFDPPDDLVAFASCAYSLLAAFMSQRFHILGAFEVPERVSPEVAELLRTLQDRLVDRAMSLTPPWVTERGDPAAAAIAAIACKEALQVAFWGPAPFGAHLGWTPPELIRELAMLTAAAVDRPAGIAPNESEPSGARSPFGP